MQPIRTAIGIRHDKSDETQWLYTYISMDDIESWIASDYIKLPVAVDKEEELYELNKIYGSNTYTLDKQPAAYRQFIFPLKDFVCAQEVHYK